MGLKHFSHHHPLIFNEEHSDDFLEESCYGCRQAISGPCYRCSQCLFFLHRICAELPQQIKHSLHPEHSLRLLKNPPYPNFTCECEACENKWKHFTYHCSICKFDVDIVCALMAQTIKHESHKHPLIPLQKPASFFCHACNERDEGTSFLCTTCQFWIHQKCASLPRTIKHGCHHHPLTLSYTVPCGWLQFRSYCEICLERLTHKDWVYCCNACRYVLHLKCTKRNIETLMDKKTKIEAEDIEPNMIHLPLIEESINLETRLIKGISTGKDESAIELNHRSHQHQIILFDGQSEVESRFRCQQSLLNGIKKDEMCKGCMEPISFPFYSCCECSFSLHKWCAELPDKLRHPCHPKHPLILVTEIVGSSSFDCGWFLCDGCSKVCRGFAFYCSHCEFKLDVRCSSLPNSIRHEAHKHILILRVGLAGRCSGCDRYLFGLSFTCKTCNFKLDARCALLPGKIRHRYDEHPFSLTYFPIKDVQEYICEICENDVNPKCWFYHCISCDQSIHADCLFPLKYAFPHLKAGDIRKFKDHNAPLTAFDSTEDNDASCDFCGEGFPGSFLKLNYRRRSVKLHVDCANVPKKVRHEYHKHPLTLTCFPIKGHFYDYYCGICKLKIDQNLWFYHCVDCNRSAHVACLRNQPVPAVGCVVDLGK